MQSSAPLLQGLTKQGEKDQLDQQGHIETLYAVHCNSLSELSTHIAVILVIFKQ